MKKTIFVLIFIATFCSSLFGQGVNGNRFHFEIEPLQFINNGWSVVGHYAINNRLQIGTNAFAQVLPESSHDFAFNISTEGDLLIEQDFGMNVSIRYFLQEREFQEGWVLSLPLGWETWTITDQQSNTAEKYAFWYLSPRIGYLWYPFQKKQVYLLGEAVGIIPIRRDNNVEFADTEISIKSIVPLPSLGIGMAF
ncbi:MAG: hypothetical protein AAFR87_21130 [Bacteroidota bacterium]